MRRDDMGRAIDRTEAWLQLRPLLRIAAVVVPGIFAAGIMWATLKFDLTDTRAMAAENRTVIAQQAADSKSIVGSVSRISTSQLLLKQAADSKSENDAAYQARTEKTLDRILARLDRERP